MKRHEVIINGYKFHIIVDGLHYRIVPDGERWSSSSIAKENTLETAINDIKEHFLFYVS